MDTARCIIIKHCTDSDRANQAKLRIVIWGGKNSQIELLKS